MLETIKQYRKMLDDDALDTGPKSDAVDVTRARLESMQEFMDLTNKLFQQFIGNAKSGLTKVVRVLLKAV